MSVRVRPPAPLPSSFEGCYADFVPRRRHMDNQLEFAVTNFSVDENLVNSGGRVTAGGVLQAHIAHGYRNVSVQKL